MKILIADDNKVFRLALIRVLKSIYTTYDFEEAGDGFEALDKLKSSKFNLIFLDVSMPTMDGYAASKLIRQSYPTLPIIMLSQFYDRDIVYHFFKVGVQSFLSKGLDTSELTLAIDSTLTGKHFFPEPVRILLENRINQGSSERLKKVA